MKIGVLTSSRADFGIYTPLLSKLKADPDFQLEIIAFGTHVSKFHGYTIEEIYAGGYDTVHAINSLLVNDLPEGISTSYSLTALKFSQFWQDNNFDYVFCLGDRFEMSAAVQAGIPHRIKFLHLHGGETTLGAIDNIYRHQITLASEIHFTATEEYSLRVKQIVGRDAEVFMVGALSLDGLEEMALSSRRKLNGDFGLPEGDFILATFHPETNNLGANQDFIPELVKALQNISKIINVVVTMPNADTLGLSYRNTLTELEKNCAGKIKLVESFGKQNYFSALSHCALVLGNSSSGIIEAATFKKWVVDVGDRQKGRAISENVVHASFQADEIVLKVTDVLKRTPFEGKNEYYRGNVANSIISVIKNRR